VVLEGRRQRCATYQLAQTITWKNYHISVAEVLNRVVVRPMGAVLHASGLPKFLWRSSAAVDWLKNRTSAVAVPSKTPNEVVTGKKPNPSNSFRAGLSCPMN